MCLTLGCTSVTLSASNRNAMQQIWRMQYFLWLKLSHNIEKFTCRSSPTLITRAPGSGGTSTHWSWWRTWRPPIWSCSSMVRKLLKLITVKTCLPCWDMQSLLGCYKLVEFFILLFFIFWMSWTLLDCSKPSYICCYCTISGEVESMK